MVIWQVFFERKEISKQNDLRMVIEKQTNIMGMNREFWLLINSYSQTLETEQDNKMKIINNGVKMSDLVLAMQSENNICKYLFEKNNLEGYKDLHEFTAKLSIEIKYNISEDVKNEDIIKNLQSLSALNFGISNICEENIQKILSL